MKRGQSYAEILTRVPRQSAAITVKMNKSRNNQYPDSSHFTEFLYRQ